jgi:RNA-binding protein 25
VERAEREERARNDRAFRDRERTWEREEADRDRERRRLKDKTREAEREREQILADDLEPETRELEAERELETGAATPDILERLLAMGPPEWVRDERLRTKRKR